jgi:FkbM family methyltransferase
MNKVTDGLAGKIEESIAQLNPKLGRIEQYGLAAARRISIPCGDNSVMIRSSVGYILCADEDHALMATLIESGELEAGTRQLIQRILNPGDVFIDVGANIGMHTLAALHVMQGKGRVVAFEPYPQTAKLLEKSIWLNGYSTMVDLHCVAVSNEKKEQTLYLGATSGHHSLFPLEESNMSVSVQVTTLDQSITDIPIVNLIKIDAEGAELEVLAGAEFLLERSRDVGIIAEFGSSHLKRIGATTQEWLEHFCKLGFEYQAIHPDTGVVNDISIEELDKIESVNLFFARPQSPIWEKTGRIK